MVVDWFLFGDVGARGFLLVVCCLMTVSSWFGDRCWLRVACWRVTVVVVCVLLCVVCCLSLLLSAGVIAHSVFVVFCLLFVAGC